MSQERGQAGPRAAQVFPCPPSGPHTGEGEEEEQTQPEPLPAWVHEHRCVGVLPGVCGKQKARNRVNYPGNISKI